MDGLGWQENGIPERTYGRKLAISLCTVVYLRPGKEAFDIGGCRSLVVGKENIGRVRWRWEQASITTDPNRRFGTAVSDTVRGLLTSDTQNRREICPGKATYVFDCIDGRCFMASIRGNFTTGATRRLWLVLESRTRLGFHAFPWRERLGC